MLIRPAPRRLRGCCRTPLSKRAQALGDGRMKTGREFALFESRLIFVSDRLTGVLLSDILTHPFFVEVDWEEMECGRSDLAEYPPVLKILKRSADASNYSPPSAPVGSSGKARHRLLDLDDVLVSTVPAFSILASYRVSACGHCVVSWWTAEAGKLRGLGRALFVAGRREGSWKFGLATIMDSMMD